MVVNANLPSIESFEAKGWFLSQEGVELIASENPEAKSLDDFINIAKDMDLRSISTKGWNKTGDKITHLPTPLVLQLLEVRNTAMPSTNQVEKPRLLSATFTDGKKKYKGAEVLGKVDSLKLHTPPGTKFFVKKSIDIQDQVLVLGPGMLDDIGGHVQELVQAWRAGKQFLKRFGGKSTAGKQEDQEGPPAFVPFKVKNHPRSADKSKKSVKKEEKANGKVHEKESSVNGRKNTRNQKVKKNEFTTSNSEHPHSDSTKTSHNQPNEVEQPKPATEKRPRAKKERKPIDDRKSATLVQPDTTPEAKKTAINDEESEQAPKKEKRKRREKGSQKKEDGLDGKEKKTILKRDMSTPPSEQNQTASAQKVAVDPVQVPTPPPEQKEKKVNNRKKKASRREEGDSKQQPQPQQEIDPSQKPIKSKTKTSYPRTNKRNSVDTKPSEVIQEENGSTLDAKKDISLQTQDVPEEASMLDKPTKSANKRKGRNKNKKKMNKETVQEESPSVEENQATEASINDRDESSQPADPPVQTKKRNSKKDNSQKKTEQVASESYLETTVPVFEKKHLKKTENTKHLSKQSEEQESKEAIEPISKHEEAAHKKQSRKSRQRSKRGKEAESSSPQATTEQEVKNSTSMSLPPPTPPSNTAAQTNATTPVAHAITTNSNINHNSSESPSQDVSASRTTTQVAEQPFYDSRQNSNPYLHRPMEPYYNTELHQPMVTTAAAHHPIPPSLQQHEYYYQHPQPVYPMIDYNMMMPYDYTTGMPPGMYNYPPTPTPLPPLIPSQQPSQPTQPQQTQPYMQPMYYIPDMATQQQSPGYYNHQMHYTQLYDEAYYRDYNSRGRGRGMATSNGRGRGRGESK
ncbi:hypothetical protein A0J61_05012 [Choanephora cucurbitarum]|uniref:RecQ mediated genome instability protein 1 OB-fold domain-containing protein n=1 Tax=Choanephora cucurbitarum TaxID=101091 RepID=A0A1C7NCW8_9FUNG|nr:hypothetical protein A0J61_05012 [Choanephora cucurbitarum]